jgi:ribosomal protein L15
MRIPKLRGFKNRFKIEYEVVNIGAIGALADRGAFEFEDTKKSSKSGPITVNQDILRAVGLVRTLNKPLKILGAGELTVPLFVVADAFTASARAKIEAAGGSVNVLEVPSSPLAALGVTPETESAKPTERPKVAVVEAVADTADAADADVAAEAEAPAPAVDETADEAPAAGKRAKPAAKAAAAKTPPAKASTQKAAAKSTKGAAKASAETADSSADEPAPADEPATTADADAESADAPTPADDTERPSGDDA